MYRKYLTAAVLLSLTSMTFSNVKQFDKEINKESRNLEDIKKSIQQIKSEKEKCLEEERRIKKELSRIQKESDALQRKKGAIRRDIVTAEKKLAKASRDMDLLSNEKSGWQSSIDNDLNVFFRQHLSDSAVFADLVLERSRVDALKQKSVMLNKTVLMEQATKNSYIQWQAAKGDLVRLKKENEELSSRTQSLKGQKEDILKTTIGKRISAEEDLLKLQESQKALENVLIELTKKKKKYESDVLAGRDLKERKNKLPWPLEGSVVSGFGKHKHPELETYIINNGIKIKSSRGSAVRAISKGEVLFAGEFRAYGLMLIIDHGGGICSVYGQLGELLIDEGNKVKDQQDIARLPDSGDSVLYFEIRQDNKPENPELWLR